MNTSDDPCALVHRALIADRIVRARRTLILWGLIWPVVGWGTIAGWAGKPEDAPHLHLDEQVRGWFLWILPGLVALVILWWDRRRLTERWTRIAAAVLILGPIIRAVSYSLAWLIWLGGKDNFGIGPWWNEGSASGWYTCSTWWAISLAILSQAYSPRQLARRVTTRWRNR